MKFYLPVKTFDVIADNFFLNKKSQKISLYKQEKVGIIYKQKDMFDDSIEHWTTSCGWVLKIHKSNLDDLIETL